ncbi:MFS general substrate transporter, partial [Periconia macrospinosa]
SNADSSKDEEKTGRESREAWLTLLGSFIVYYSSAGILNSFGFFQEYYETDFLKNIAVSPSTISFIGTLQIALVNCLATISGALCDVYGVKYLYIASSLGLSSAFLALSFIKPIIWHLFLSQGLLMGVAIAFSAQPALTIVSQHFDAAQRGLAMSIVYSGSATGGLCFNFMFTTLKARVGFPWTMRVAAGKVLVLHAVALRVSSRMPRCENGKRKVSMGTLFDFKGFRDGRYVILAVGAWFAHLGLWIPGYHITSYMNSAHREAAIGKYINSIMSGVSIPVMVVGGFIGDRVGKLNVLWPAALGAGSVCLLFWLPDPSILALIAFAALYGVFSGTFMALLPATVTEIVKMDEKVGARMGAFYSVIATASLIGPPVGSALVMNEGKTKEDYKGLVVLAVCIILL